MAVVVKNAKKGVIFSYSNGKSGTKYRILNLEDHYNNRPFDIKLLNHKGVDIVASGEAFVSDIVFPKNVNKEVLTPEFYKIEENVNAYSDKLKQLSEEYRHCYHYYGKQHKKTVDYYDQTYFALTYKMRGFKDLHCKHFTDDQNNIDGVTAFSIFLTLKAKQGSLEDFYECEEEQEEEEEESEYEPGDEVRSDESGEDEFSGDSNEEKVEKEDKTKSANKIEKTDKEAKDETKTINENEENDNVSKYKTKSVRKVEESDMEEKKPKSSGKDDKNNNENEKHNIDAKEVKNEDKEQSEEEEEYSDDSEEWETEEENIDWDSEDELNVILYKDKPDDTKTDDKTWMYHYFGREYSPIGSMKWYRAFRNDESFHLSTRNRYGSPDSRYWDCIPDYLEYVKKPKGLKPCHIKAFKDVDFNCIYIEHESIIPKSIEIRQRKLPVMFEKQSKVFDLYDKDAEKPYGTIIEISYSPPLTDYNYHSDEGFYEAGVNYYSNNKGIVLTGEQNIPTFFYGMAIYEGIFIPDVFFDTP